MNLQSLMIRLASAKRAGGRRALIYLVDRATGGGVRLYRRAIVRALNPRLALHALIQMAETPDGTATSEQLASCLRTNPVVVRRTMAGLRTQDTEGDGFFGIGSC
jgi:hypothetical protein